MTNAEIILGEMVVAGLDPLEVEVDTYIGWKRKGFQVKRGEEAVFKTRIWKPKSKAQLEKEEEQLANGEAVKYHNRMSLVPAAFFTNNQVEAK